MLFKSIYEHLVVLKEKKVRRDRFEAYQLLKIQKLSITIALEGWTAQTSDFSKAKKGFYQA